MRLPSRWKAPWFRTDVERGGETPLQRLSTPLAPPGGARMSPETRLALSMASLVGFVKPGNAPRLASASASPETRRGSRLEARRALLAPAVAGRFNETSLGSIALARFDEGAWRVRLALGERCLDAA